MTKKILICGATGFIGRNLAEKFSKNKKNNLYCIYFKSKPYKLKGATWIKADLRQHSDVKKIINNDIDIVIQAAATTTGSKDVINQPYIHVTDNAIMNALLFRASYEKNIKHVIFFSCTTMYKSSQKPIKEDNFNPLKDINPKYFGVANTKLYNEKMCEFFAKLGNTKFTAIRHSNIYGPYDKYDLKRSHVFGATITKVMKAKDKIIVWGKGDEKRDLLHVNDLVDFVELTLKKQKENFLLLNCGLGKSISIKNLVKKIIKASGKKITINFDLNKPNIPTFLSVNCELAKKKLGWKPKIQLDKGIDLTISWWKKNFK